MPVDPFRNLCQNHGWKCTAQRRALYDYLKDNLVHPSVETVWSGARQRLPDLSLDSAYRILDEFAEVGIVRKLESGKVYRYDFNTVPHDHFVCSECGTLYDIDVLEAAEVTRLCQSVPSIGSVTSFELEVRGVCQDCLTALKKVTM